MLHFSPSRTLKTIALSLGVLATLFLASVVVLAWTDPSQTPPGANVPAPINVGPTAQTKAGALTIAGGGGDALILRNGGDLRLYNAANSGSALLYCDNNGEIITPGNLTAGGEMRAGTVRANSSLCIGSDCRTSWPAGGDITGVYAGTNLTGGGSSGEVTLSTVMNPTFDDVYVNNWFRNNQAGEGLYNQATGRHWYSVDSNYWDSSAPYGIRIRDGYQGTIRGYLYADGTNVGLLPPDGGWQVRAWNSGVELYDTTYMNAAQANIFYDRNNTGYYVDPASTSRMNEIQADRVYGFADIRSPIFYDYNNTGYYVDPASTSRLNYGVFDNVYSYGWMQGPIFYDSNDNGYYLDPNGTTNLSTLCIRGDCKGAWPPAANFGDWYFSGDNLISNGWGHIYTSSSNLHLDSYSGEMYLNYYYNNWVSVGNRDTGYLYIGNTQLYDDNDWFRIYSGANNRIYTNSYLRVDNNLEVNGNIYYGTGGVWLSSWLNQAVLTTSGPTFDTVYTGNWFRSNGNSGWYNQSYGGGWWMTDATWIRTYNSKGVWTDTGLLGSNGGLTIGSGGTTPPSGGAIIAGSVGIGATSWDAYYKVYVNGPLKLGGFLSGQVFGAYQDTSGGVSGRTDYARNMISFSGSTFYIHNAWGGDVRIIPGMWGGGSLYVDNKIIAGKIIAGGSVVGAGDDTNTTSLSGGLTAVGGFDCFNCTDAVTGTPNLWLVTGNTAESNRIYLRSEGGSWTYDIAELFPSTENLEPGDIVTTSNHDITYIETSKKERDNGVIGIISTNPALLIDGSGLITGRILTPEEINAQAATTEEEKETLMEIYNQNKGRYPLSLSGRAPAKVTNANGNINYGDLISTSNLPGIGMKATEAGPIVGKAISVFNPTPNNCPSVSSLNDIHWPKLNDNDDYETLQRSCFRLPDGTYVGKIMVFVNLSWYDPDVYLTFADFVQKVKQALAEFTLQDFKEIFAGIGLTIENGILQVKEFVAEKITAKEAVLDEVESKEITTDRIKMRDRATGEIYCTWIENGEWVKEKGECELEEVK